MGALKDIPALPLDPRKIDPAVRQPLDAMRTSVQMLLGLRGDGLDRALTQREARSLGILDSGGTFVGGGGAGTATEPDLTPPPAVTNLTATAGLAHVIVEWDAPTYAMGHGHQKTNIYAVKKLAADPSLPTFGDATIVDEATGARTIAAIPSDLGIRWHLWAKFETNDEVESVAPAGGVNGVVAQTGLIGGVDLSSQIVEARHLKTATPSVIADQTFETWVANGSSAPVQRLAATNPAVPAGSPLAFAVQYNGRDGASGPLIPVFPGEQYRLSLYVNRTGLGTTGAGVMAYGYDAAGVASTLGAAGPNVASTAWERMAINVTIPAGIYGMRVGPWINQAHGGTLTAWFTGLLVEKRIDATLVTANMIVAGSGAIGALAVENAAIAALAVDDGKVANLSAAKLTVGDGTIGGNLKSTNYVGGSTGWIVRPDGYAEFSNTVIRGAVYTGTIFANAGTIGGITIGAADIRSTNYVPATSGFRINSDGSAEFMNIYARGNIAATSITVAAVSNSINGGATTGARIEVAANVIRVFDETNVLRVKLGNLA